MADTVFCNSCGKPINGEAPNWEPSQRKPCPKCGSLARRLDLHVSGTLALKGSVVTAVISYPEALLSTAHRLIADGEFSVAAVVAHMACEICVERALSRAFVAKGVGYLQESVVELLTGYNLANERVRNLYNAMTGTEIHKQAFWQEFKSLATQRNQAVHRGRIITREEAEASIKAATDLVAFLK